MQDRKCRLELMSFPSSCSTKLRAAADKWHDWTKFQEAQEPNLSGLADTPNTPITQESQPYVSARSASITDDMRGTPGQLQIPLAKDTRGLQRAVHASLSIAMPAQSQTSTCNSQKVPVSEAGSKVEFELILQQGMTVKISAVRKGARVEILTKA